MTNSPLPFRIARFVAVATLLLLAGCGKTDISGTYAAVDSAEQAIVLRIVQNSHNQINGSLDVEMPNGKFSPALITRHRTSQFSRESQIQSGLTAITMSVTGTLDKNNIILNITGGAYAIAEIGSVEHGNLSLVGNLTGGKNAAYPLILKRITNGNLARILVAIESATYFQATKQKIRMFDAAVPHLLAHFRRRQKEEKDAISAVKAAITDKERIVATTAETPQFGTDPRYASLLARLAPPAEAVDRVHLSILKERKYWKADVLGINSSVSALTTACRSAAPRYRTTCAKFLQLSSIYRNSYKRYVTSLTASSVFDSSAVHSLDCSRRAWNGLRAGPAWPAPPSLNQAVIESSSSSHTSGGALPSRCPVQSLAPSTPLPAAGAIARSHTARAQPTMANPFSQ